MSAVQQMENMTEVKKKFLRKRLIILETKFNYMQK